MSRCPCFYSVIAGGHLLFAFLGIALSRLLLSSSHASAFVVPLLAVSVIAVTHLCVSYRYVCNRSVSRRLVRQHSASITRPGITWRQISFGQSPPSEVSPLVGTHRANITRSNITSLGNPFVRKHSIKFTVHIDSSAINSSIIIS